MTVQVYCREVPRPGPSVALAGCPRPLPALRLRVSRLSNLKWPPASDSDSEAVGASEAQPDSDHDAGPGPARRRGPGAAVGSPAGSEAAIRSPRPGPAAGGGAPPGRPPRRGLPPHAGQGGAAAARGPVQPGRGHGDFNG
jgi:hypothetical protein